MTASHVTSAKYRQEVFVEWQVQWFNPVLKELSKISAQPIRNRALKTFRNPQRIQQPLSIFRITQVGSARTQMHRIIFHPSARVVDFDVLLQRFIHKNFSITCSSSSERDPAAVSVQSSLQVRVAWP